MRIEVRHDTIYRYQAPPRSIVQLLRLTPPSFETQHVRNWRIDVGTDAVVRQGSDAFGNCVHRLYAELQLTELAISVIGDVDVEDSAGVVRGTEEPLPPQMFLRTTPLTSPDATLAAFAQDVTEGCGAPLDRLHALLRAVHAHMAFDTRVTDSATSAAQAFVQSAGVCQDFAHIFIAAARYLGIPARYVSGHLLRGDGQHAQEAAHAWAEAHVDGLGWVAFDPAHGLCTTDHYVRVAVALDYLGAAPVRGSRAAGGIETLTVDLAVQPGQARGQLQRQE